MMAGRLVAVFTTFEDLTDPRIERFGNDRLDWLRTFLKLENGVPSHDTFGRVFVMLDPAELLACVQR